MKLGEMLHVVCLIFSCFEAAITLDRSREQIAYALCGTLHDMTSVLKHFPPADQVMVTSTLRTGMG